MQWSPQQDRALVAIRRWLKDPHAPQIMRVFGYAGTGKTTMAKQIAADVDGDVLFMCFTGKAALVLQKKGCTGASTIHGAIYIPDEDVLTGQMRFRLNPESGVLGADLIIVDEVGMVGQELGADLVSFGRRILVLGDPFQLPPIDGAGYFTDCEPDILLTEIHRQAADNPIIRMSMDIREGRGLVAGQYGESRVIPRETLKVEDVLDSDQVIVGMNRTRVAFNRRIRQLKGFESEAPVLGDRLVCLRNNRTKGLLNGSLWEPKSFQNAKAPKIKMTLRSLDDDKVVPVDVNTRMEYFLGTEKELDRWERKHNDEFTFGWALTCHKAQGSAWDDLLVFDESRVFREHAQRWAYTAVTRAAERITVVQT